MNQGKDVQRVLTGATGTGAGATFRFQLGPSVGASAQVSIVGTSATVAIEGRMSPDAPFAVLATTSAGGVISVPQAMTEMRANVTAIVAATIEVWVMA